MQNTTTLLRDIAHLTEIRRAYNHFLASYRSIHDVENATYIKNNLKIINISINKLHEESDKIKDDKKLVAKGYPRIINHVSTPSEDRAIMLFNSDKRYRYRE
jgi:hypothetical protein